jgi:Raf kinase inhibitor-like YbhB/YbcL family protein
LLRPIHAGDEKMTSHRDGVATGVMAGLTVQSSAFGAGQPIPRKYAGEGENVSPPLEWSNVPAGARELVLICEDPDAPLPQPFIHWCIFGIDPRSGGVQENVPKEVHPAVPAGTTQGRNSGKKTGYTGPMPPPGHGVHHYHFQLFALDQKLNIAPDTDRDAWAKQMKGHVLATGELVGTYERK